MPDHKRGDLSHLKEGDPVKVRTYNNVYDGKVVKRGRTLLHVTFRGSSIVEAFQMKTGQYNGEGNLCVYSLEQHEYNTRVSEVTTVLRDAGIDLRFGTKLPLDALEKIADIAKEYS